MMKNRSSKTNEVHSGHHLYASFMQRRRRADTSSSSSSSSPSLHIYKYYNSSSRLTNHAFLSDNHTFKVHNYTVDSGINAYHNYDNYTDCTSDNRIGSAQNGDGSYRSNDNLIDEDEDGFTFSSTVAGSMEFFTSAACAAHELARLSNMSPADELFVDGKIRPLMLAPLTNGPDQPTNLSTPFIDGHDQPTNRFINGEDPPNFPKPIIDGQDQPPNFHGHDQPNCMFNGNDQPNRSKPLILSEPNINGDDQLNPIMDGQDQSKPMLDHSKTSAPAAQSVLSANEKVIKQIISANDSTVIKQEIDAERILKTSQHDKGLEHKAGKVDHGLSRKPNQILKEDCNDQRVISEAINHSGMHSSLSAPASPVKDFVVDMCMNELQEGSNEFESSTSCYYKRCRSLSRVVLECEHIKQQHLVELDDGRTKGGHLHNMRQTLQDLLKQEDKPTIINKPKMMKNKQETPYNENIVINSYDALIKSPSLAPVPINIPQLWPVREKLLATPTRTKNSNKKVRAPSPHGMHYAFQKAQAERMKKKTFLPYRPGLLGCLGYPPL